MRMERTVREIAGDYAVLENESGGTTEVALALLPDEPRPWVLHVFLDRHECFAQYYGYTFRKRFGWPAPAAWAAAAGAWAFWRRNPCPQRMCCTISAA